MPGADHSSTLPLRASGFWSCRPKDEVHRSQQGRCLEKSYRVIGWSLTISALVLQGPRDGYHQVSGLGAF